MKKEKETRSCMRHDFYTSKLLYEISRGESAWPHMSYIEEKNRAGSTRPAGDQVRRAHHRRPLFLAVAVTKRPLTAGRRHLDGRGRRGGLGAAASWGRRRSTSSSASIQLQDTVRTGGRVWSMAAGRQRKQDARVPHLASTSFHPLASYLSESLPNGRRGNWQRRRRSGAASFLSSSSSSSSTIFFRWTPSFCPGTCCWFNNSSISLKLRSRAGTWIEEQGVQRRWRLEPWGVAMAALSQWRRWGREPRPTRPDHTKPDRRAQDK